MEGGCIHSWKEGCKDVLVHRLSQTWEVAGMVTGCSGRK